MVKSNIYPYPLTGTEYYFLSLYNNGISHKALGVERGGLRIIIWKVSTPDGIESINISNRCDLNNHVHYAKYPGDRKRFLAVFVDDDNANKRNDLFRSHYSRIHCVIPKYDNEIILRKLRKINASELACDQSDCLTRTGNGLVIGVEPQMFIDEQFQHDSITKLIVTKDMPERKAKMIELGDAFIAFPGGTGTLEEIAEVMSLVSLKLLDSPCILYPDRCGGSCRNDASLFAALYVLDLYGGVLHALGLYGQLYPACHYQ